MFIVVGIGVWVYPNRICPHGHSNSLNEEGGAICPYPLASIGWHFSLKRRQCDEEVPDTFVSMKHNKQKHDKRKSLPRYSKKETSMKSINGEGHGAVAGNASAKNQNQSGSERLNRFALTHSNSAAKLQQNTETTKKSVLVYKNSAHMHLTA